MKNIDYFVQVSAIFTPSSVLPTIPVAGFFGCGDGQLEICRAGIHHDPFRATNSQTFDDEY